MKLEVGFDLINKVWFGFSNCFVQIHQYLSPVAGLAQAGKVSKEGVFQIKDILGKVDLQMERKIIYHIHGIMEMVLLQWHSREKVIKFT